MEATRGRAPIVCHWTQVLYISAIGVISEVLAQHVKEDIYIAQVAHISSVSLLC